MNPSCNATTTPGGLVVINGSGVLLQGKSGTGKSDLTLQLLDRGHQLVADDVVEIAVDETLVIGRAPTRLRGHMEIRGLGPCLVEALFGPEALREQAAVSLVITLERPTDWSTWPRLAPEADHVGLAGITVPRVRLPVGPERPLALVVEAVARLHTCGQLQSETEHA